MTKNKTHEILDAYFAEADRLRALAIERRAAFKARYDAHMANLHTTGPMPAIKVGALCPADAYAEAERRGWSTD